MGGTVNNMLEEKTGGREKSILLKLSAVVRVFSSICVLLFLELMKYRGWRSKSKEMSVL